MSILITGATGTIGSHVVQRLAAAGADVKALVRKPGKVAFPEGVSEVVADLTDIAAMRAALSSVRTLFLLNAVSPDELTQALIALDLPVTVLRPAYFMQNDRTVQPVIEGFNTYPMPIGSAGVSMIDTRDIADIAVAELLRRDRAEDPLPRLTLDLVGPHALTGTDVAAVWTRALGRSIVYAGDDVDGFEKQMAANGPTWMAYDMRLMMSAIQQLGMHSDGDAVGRLQVILGRPLRSYADFVRELTEPGMT